MLDWFKTADESYKLPVTRGFPQLATQLCWVYSTFNALESRYLYLHPNGKIELSRGVMQYLTMQDRVIRKFDGEDYLSERGDEVDALKLVKDFGLVAFSDYRDIFNSIEGSYSGVYQRSNRGATREEKIQNLKIEMLEIFPALPSMTHSEGQAATPPQLNVDVLGGDEWLSYAPMTSGTEGMRDHPDPARVHARMLEITAIR